MERLTEFLNDEKRQGLLMTGLGLVLVMWYGPAYVLLNLELTQIQVALENWRPLLAGATLMVLGQIVSGLGHDED